MTRVAPSELERFDHTPDAPWLDRFVSRRPLRNFGPLRLYACRREEAGPEWPVLVGRASVDARQAGDALDRLARSHARLDHPWIAQVHERACVGEMEFLVFAHEVAADLESLLALQARRSLAQLSYAAGEGWALGLLDALAHAHRHGEALGRLGASNVLVGRTARVACLALAVPSSAPHSSMRRCSRLHPRRAPGPRRTGTWAPGRPVMRSYRHAFQRPAALELAQRAQPLDRAHAWLEKSVRELEHALTGAHASLSAEQARTQLRARHARLGVLANEPAGLDVHALEAAWREALRPLLELSQSEQRAASAPPGHGERYRFEGPLGSGATSTVFKAWDRQLRQYVAIKRLSAPSGTESVMRLLREVRTLREVRHPHLVRGYELYEDRGQIGAVMEYVAGPTLHDALAAGRLSFDEAREALAQVADALSDLHRMGIVHRDIKPSNVILAPERGAVLVDFGVAAAADRDGTRKSATLTLPGRVLGEASYQAPELLAGGFASRASDVYALACTACEALQRERQASALSTLYEPLRTRLVQALAANPAERPSALELSAALRADPATDESPARQVALDGRGLTSAEGQHVDLSKRTTLRRVLAALAQAHRQRPGQPVSRDALFAAGWPGERIDESSAANRVYVAVAELRKLGLRGVLESDADGYVLSPQGVRCIP